MLDIDIQTPDLPGQMGPILGELKQLRESNALLKKRHTEIEAELARRERLGCKAVQDGFWISPGLRTNRK